MRRAAVFVSWFFSQTCAAGRYYGKGGGGGGGYYSQGLRSITADLVMREVAHRGKGGDGGGSLDVGLQKADWQSLVTLVDARRLLLPKRGWRWRLLLTRRWRRLHWTPPALQM